MLERCRRGRGRGSAYSCFVCRGSWCTLEPRQRADRSNPRAGHKVPGEDQDELTGDKLLNALCHAAMLDMQTAHATELSRVRSGPEAAPTQKAILDAETQRADHAERQWRQSVIERDSVTRDYIRERDERRQLQTILRNGGVLPAESDEEPAPVEPKRERIPAGVRKRGDGYQAYWRGATGKQQQQGGFTTAADAKTHRDAEMQKVSQAKVKARNVMPEVSADRGVEQVQAEYGEMVKAGLA